MSNVLCIFTLLLATVSATFIPRASHPKGWLVDYLEPYDVYHTRYTALGCQFQHGKPFFDQCCHPMLATETLATARGPQCVPSPAALSSASAAEPTSTVTTPASDGSDCDDDGAESSSTVSSKTPAATPTPGPVVNPASDPEPAPAKPETTTTTSTTTTPKPETSTSKSSATPTPSSTPSSSSSSFSGFGTFFFQNGVAGACGTVHPDSALIAAIDVERYGNTGQKSSLCGKQVKITNTANQKSVVVTIEDACPTCNTRDSIDLSTGAFDKLADESIGLINIRWEFV